MRVFDGIYWLDEEWSARERAILDHAGSFLERRGFTYLTIPSSVRAETYRRQGLVESDGQPILGQRVGEGPHRLAGSAEQGILERFTGQEVGSRLIWARNQCFRHELEYEGLRRVREFQKVEQFSFCEEAEAEQRFDLLLQNALDLLDEIGVRRRRVVDVSERDRGEYRRKLDIEVWTSAYGWLETHSCTDYGRYQSRRYEITGADWTISNTAVASPRILVPLMEAEGARIPH